MMKRFILMMGCALASLAAVAQTTNVPLTKIEIMEARTETTLVKGFAPVGSIAGNGGTISIRIKSTTEINTGRKLGAISLEIIESQQSGRTIIDYDELDELLNGIDYVSKVDYDVTPLPGFEAVYTTRAGLRVVAYTSKKSETIQMYVQSANSSKIYFAANELSQFRALVQQAKTNLDTLLK
jgi:hypothetical protein